MTAASFSHIALVVCSTFFGDKRTCVWMINEYASTHGAVLTCKTKHSATRSQCLSQTRIPRLMVRGRELGVEHKSKHSHETSPLLSSPYSALQQPPSSYSSMQLSAPVFAILASLMPIHAHPTFAPTLLAASGAASTQGYCWFTVYKLAGFKGAGLRIAFAEHYCYDLSRALGNFPDD